jgi:tetratricopeptide (TPR) repeat protein
MGRGGTDDIPHVTFTDHWIRRVLPPARPPEEIERGGVRAEPFRLVDVTAREEALAGGRAADEAAVRADVEAALAYWVLYETDHRLPAYLPDVAGRVRRGLAAGVHRPEAYLALGGALRDMDSLAAATEAYAEGTRRWPAHPRLLYGLGDARLRQGDAVGAAEALARAVAAQPRFTEARLKLAEALGAAGRPEQAVAAYREALRRDPARHAEGWNNLGFQLLQLGRTADAADALRRAVGLRPPFVEARTNLGAALLAADDLDGAAAEFEAALRHAPDYVPALGNLGVVRARQRRNEEAIALFRRVLALSPGDAQAAAYLQQLSPS